MDGNRARIYKDIVVARDMSISVFLSPNLVSNFKVVNFGWQNSHAFMNYHHVISPFAMPNTMFELYLTAIYLGESLD